MSFSTPSMNPEIHTTTTTKQHNLLLPRINTPFAAYNLPKTQHTAFASPQPVMFPTSNMPSPWHTAQFLHAQQSTQQMLPSTQQPTMWATSALPPVEIQVQETAAENPDIPANTKVSWTSAEQLADAIFPTRAESLTNAVEHYHHGLLNHKAEIENLYETHAQMSDESKDHHFGLLNHKEEIEKLHARTHNLSATLKRQTDSLSTHQVLHSAYDTKHTNLKNNLKEMEDKSSKMQKSVEDNNLKLQEHHNSIQKIESVLQDHAKSKDSMTEGFLNHRDTLRAMQSKLTSNSQTTETNSRELKNCRDTLQDVQNMQDKLRKKAEMQDKSMLSLQESIDDIKFRLQKSDTTSHKLTDLHERTSALEHSVQAHAKKITSIVSPNDTAVQFQVLGPRRK